MPSTAAMPETVHLATDTGQNLLAAFGIVLLGLPVLIALCAYLFRRFAARNRSGAATRAGTLRDVAVLCATAALGTYLYGVLCYFRWENAWYTCLQQRYGYATPEGMAELEDTRDSLLPVGSVCRWSDGYTHDFVPAFVNPATAVLLVLAAVAAGAALGHAGTARRRAGRGDGVPVSRSEGPDRST
jgi:hypothetical protein